MMMRQPKTMLLMLRDGDLSQPRTGRWSLLSLVSILAVLQVRSLMTAFTIGDETAATREDPIATTTATLASAATVVTPLLPPAIVRLSRAQCDRLNTPHLYRRRAKTARTAELDRLDDPDSYALDEATVLRTGFVRNDDVSTAGHLRGRQLLLLEKVAQNRPVTVVTLGGSFTRGHGCGEQQWDDERACAWPSRLEQWWDQVLMAPYSTPVIQNNSNSNSSSNSNNSSNNSNNSNNSNSSKSHVDHIRVPHIRSHWEHLAEHGASSVTALQRIGILVGAMVEEPDLVILDFLVNDIGEGDILKATVGHESLIRKIRELLPRSQILLVEDGCRDCLQPGQNALILHRRRQIAAHYRLPVVDYAAMVQHHNVDNVDVDNADDRHNYHHHHLLWPMTDPPLVGPYVQEGAPWPDFWPPVNVTQTTCCPENHPPWPVHQYYADAVAYGLVQILKWDGGCMDMDVEWTMRENTTTTTTIASASTSTSLQPQQRQHVQSPPFFDPTELAQFPACSSPLVYHDAQQVLSSRTAPKGGSLGANAGNANATMTTASPWIQVDPIVVRGNWTLYEDRPGRPGWISTEVGSILRFPVRLGTTPMVAVTYLRSYESLGNADLVVHSRTNSSVFSTVSLYGLWENKHSLPDTGFFVERADGVHGDLLSVALGQDGYDADPAKWREEHGGGGGGNSSSSSSSSAHHPPQPSDDGVHYYMLDVVHVSGGKFKILQVSSC